MYQDIVVGTDGSETAAKAVGRAAGLARAYGARLRIVTAYAPVSAARIQEELSRVPADQRFMVNLERQAEQLLADATAQARGEGEPLEVTTHPLQGDPAEALIRVAEQYGSDLIVVGNKGMVGARRFLLGSVPNKVTHHAPCDVLVVRTT